VGHRVPRGLTWGLSIGLTLGLGPGLVLPAAAGAQAPGSVEIFPVQDLRFGTLPTGAAGGVDPRDASRRAELEIRGKGEYLLEVLLPAEMASPAGFTFPLGFNGGDGVLQWLKSGLEQPLDPTLPYPLDIPAQEKGVRVFLGGTALPPRDQPPGLYSASITVRVTYLGT
jgi:hypothetical protein